MKRAKNFFYTIYVVLFFAPHASAMDSNFLNDALRELSDYQEPLTQKSVEPPSKKPKTISSGPFFNPSEDIDPLAVLDDLYMSEEIYRSQAQPAPAQYQHENAEKKVLLFGTASAFKPYAKASRKGDNPSPQPASDIKKIPSTLFLVAQTDELEECLQGVAARDGRQQWCPICFKIFSGKSEKSLERHIFAPRNDNCRQQVGAHPCGQCLQKAAVDNKRAYFRKHCCLINTLKELIGVPDLLHYKPKNADEMIANLVAKRLSETQ